MGILLVLEEGRFQRVPIESFIARVTGLPEPLESISGPGIFDLGRWIMSGLAIVTASPVGFDVLKFTWSTNALVGDASRVESTMDVIERLLCTSIDELEPRFGFLSHYSDHFDMSWIEQNVMIPLLAEEWRDLGDPLYHLVLHAPDVPYPPYAEATVLYESSKGRLLRLGEHRGPYPTSDSDS